MKKYYDQAFNLFVIRETGESDFAKYIGEWRDIYAYANFELKDLISSNKDSSPYLFVGTSAFETLIEVIDKLITMEEKGFVDNRMYVLNWTADADYYLTVLDEEAA